MWTITKDPTMTGGTAVNLKGAGWNNGTSTFVPPDATRLSPTLIKIGTSGGNVLAQEVGIAKTSLQVSKASRGDDAECCTARPGSVVFDLGVRWNLNQPQSEAEDALSIFLAVVNSDEFRDAIVNGLLPQ